MFQTVINKKIVVLCGIPCSGKSTWAEEFQLEWREFVKTISRDQIRTDKYGKDYRFSTSNEQKVSVIADQMVDRCLSDNNTYWIILDNTHCKRAYINDILRKYGKKAEITIHYFDIPLWKAHYRNVKRYLFTGKWIPINVMNSMYKNYKKMRYEGGFKGYNIQS